LPRRVATPVSAYAERVILVVFVALVVIFVLIPIIGFAISTLITGLIIGALGRLIVPGWQPIGVLATLACGVAGAFIGRSIGHNALHVGGFATLLIEIGVAAVAVAIWAGIGRRSLPGRRAAIGGPRG
jgi:uncharacterized membrane protein YeaQ/YmgE (transglycosylase-associated protein family)